MALIESGYDVVVLDNLCNGSAQAIERLRRITGTAPVLVQGDVRDRACLDKIFNDHTISAVMHFAGLKAVGESVAKPLDYYENNVAGTLSLLAVLRGESRATAG